MVAIHFATSAAHHDVFGYVDAAGLLRLASAKARRLGVRCPDLREDVSQEALLRLLEKAKDSRFTGRQHVVAYLHGIVRNVVAEQRRAADRNGSRSMRVSTLIQSCVLPATDHVDSEAETLAVQRELREALVAAIGRLTPALKRVALLDLQEGAIEAAKAAELLGVARRTIDQCRRRYVAALRADSQLIAAFVSMLIVRVLIVLDVIVGRRNIPACHR